MIIFLWACAPKNENCIEGVQTPSQAAFLESTVEWGLEDIQADYGVAGTGKGLESLKEICSAALTPLDSVQHMNGNHWSRIDNGTAEAGCYFRVHMTREDAVGGAHFEMGGKYTDQLTLTDAGWRIAKRRIDLIWSSGNPEVRYPTS